MLMSTAAVLFIPATHFDKRITRRLRELRNWCRREGIDVTPGGEVSEEAATRAVGYRGTDTLAVQRAEGRLSPLLRLRRHGRGYLYDLHSCAVFIESRYDAMLDENVTK
jgi:hypothetical protein